MQHMNGCGVVDLLCTSTWCLYPPLCLLILYLFYLYKNIINLQSFFIWKKIIDQISYCLGKWGIRDRTLEVKAVRMLLKWPSCATQVTSVLARVWWIFVQWSHHTWLKVNVGSLHVETSSLYSKNHFLEQSISRDQVHISMKGLAKKRLIFVEAACIFLTDASVPFPTHKGRPGWSLSCQTVKMCRLLAPFLMFPWEGEGSNVT